MSAFVKCESCDKPERHSLYVTTAEGHRIAIETMGYGDRAEAMKAVLSTVRAEVKS